MMRLGKSSSIYSASHRVCADVCRMTRVRIHLKIKDVAFNLAKGSALDLQ